MFYTRLQATLTLGWFAALGIIFSTRVALGAPASLRDGAIWLLVAGIPALVLAPLFRGAPQTVAEVLYEAEHTALPAVRIGTDSHAPRG